MKEGKAYLAHGLWRFQSIICWMQGRVAWLRDNISWWPKTAKATGGEFREDSVPYIVWRPLHLDVASPP